jgi:putrescine importer
MESKIKLKRALSMWSMVMLGLGYLTPAVIFDTFGIALRDTKGHVPTAYTLTLIAMIFTAYSYARMVRVYSSAGSSYSYALKIFGPKMGFMVGWLSLLDYLLLPLINVLLAQQYLSVIFPGTPSWAWVFIITSLVTIINIRGIQTTAQVNSLFVYFQFAIVFAFIVLCVNKVQSGMGLGVLVSSTPFYSENFDLSAIINGATILCFSFLGFDAVANYSEEATDAKRDVPRAILLTALLGGGLFIITSYFTQLVYPDISVFKDIENSTAAEISFYLGGKIFQIFFLFSSLVGVFASGLASHASVSRLLYVMGRDGVLSERLFGRLSERYQTPVANIIIIGIICLFALLFTVETAIHFISFGSLVAFFSVNLSVIAHFAIKNKAIKTSKEILLNFVIPLVGLIIIFMLWLNIKQVALILGFSWGVFGLLYLGFLKKFKKVKFESLYQQT